MNPEPSEYLRHLPQVLQAPSPRTGRSFLGEFLKIFEALLSGRSDAATGSGRIVSLQERVERFAEYLDPSLVPLNAAGGATLSSDFLNYLASWVALTLDQNWDMTRKRTWLSQIVPLYKRRGTLVGIQTYLSMFVGNQVTVDEPPGGFVVAQSSTVGEDTFIAGGPAYYFRVRIAYAFGSAPFDFNVWNNLWTGARAIVDLEKPAHTYYTLDARTPGFVVGIHSTVAADTLIWERSQAFPE